MRRNTCANRSESADGVLGARYARQGTNWPHDAHEAQRRYRGEGTAPLVEEEVVKPVAGVVEEVDLHCFTLVRVEIKVIPDGTGS